MMSERSDPGRSILRIPASAKAELRIMFLAKHALGDGSHDTEDGNHAVYHHELRHTLEAIGLNVLAANSYEHLFNRPDVDFVVPLLNRGGFQNSEMLAPLLLARHGLPFLGAGPMLRGLSDDKHLMKMAARHHGVPTMDWAVYRQGSKALVEPAFRAERLVVKPNASSASWGLRIVDDWNAARSHIEHLHAQRHDAIVEPWVPLIDVAVPVIGGAEGSWLLPPMMYQPPDPTTPRSYEEKRALVAVGDDPLVRVEDQILRARLETQTRLLMTELWPFDYGRFEFRYDPASGSLQFMEVNLSCNLWSKKTISRAAAHIGVDHASLVETIVAHSLMRQGLLRADMIGLAA
jgi:D-alanine-D-alanine ligase